MRAITYIDGQNLFFSVKESFGYHYPNYDVKLLSEKLCLLNGWSCKQVRFYTGIPDSEDNWFWNGFWTAKLRSMSRKGIITFARSLRYRNKTVKLPDGNSVTTLVGDEKGIDVRIAVDILRSAMRKEFDVAIIISQDQDFSEVAREIRRIAKEQRRYIKIASAFPVSPTSRNKRGIESTDWIKFDRALYTQCIDHYDYRPRR